MNLTVIKRILGDSTLRDKARRVQEAIRCTETYRSPQVFWKGHVDLDERQLGRPNVGPEFASAS